MGPTVLHNFVRHELILNLGFRRIVVAQRLGPRVERLLLRRDRNHV